MWRSVLAVLAVGAAALVVAVSAEDTAVAHDGSCSGRTAPAHGAGAVPTPPDDQDCDSVKDPPAGPDNCPPRFENDFSMRNPDQTDSDGDGRGDKCDENDDNDEYLDADDNCRTVANDQQDSDGDGIGDACAFDTDLDGTIDPRDNCPRTPNPGQEDADGDLIGDACDNDDDEDYFRDGEDNCPLVYNQDQTDADGDGRGAACDPDDARSAGGGVDDGGAGGGGDAGPRDRTAPKLRLRLARVQRLGELGRTLAVGVRCSEACAVRARLTMGRRVARRLRIGRRTTTVAAGAAALGGRGTTYVFMPLERRKLRRLGRGRVRALLRVTATDEAGNSRTARRTVRLRR